MTAEFERRVYAHCDLQMLCLSAALLDFFHKSIREASKRRGEKHGGPFEVNPCSTPRVQCAVSTFIAFS